MKKKKAIDFVLNEWIVDASMTYRRTSPTGSQQNASRHETRWNIHDDAKPRRRDTVSANAVGTVVKVSLIYDTFQVSNRPHNNNNKTVCYLNGWEISNPESRLLIYTNSELVNPILDSTRFDINDTSYQCTQLLLESSQFWENNIQQHDVFISSFSDRCRWQRGQNRLLFLWIHSFDLLASR